MVWFVRISQELALNYPSLLQFNSVSIKHIKNSLNSFIIVSIATIIFFLNKNNCLLFTGGTRLAFKTLDKKFTIKKNTTIFLKNNKT